MVNTGVAWVGDYDHLNQDTPLIVLGPPLKVSVYDPALVVRAALNANYGLHRLLSALLRELESDVGADRGEGRLALAVSLRRWLEEGNY